MYFEAQTSYYQRNEKGKMKLVKEKLMLDGCTYFGQAEQITYQHYSGMDVVVDDISKSLITEFINAKTDDEQLIYMATISMLVEENGKMKKIKFSVGLYAKTMKEAYKCTESYMADTLGEDMTCERIKKTDIVEVLTYN